MPANSVVHDRISLPLSAHLTFVRYTTWLDSFSKSQMPLQDSVELPTGCKVEGCWITQDTKTWNLEELTALSDWPVELRPLSQSKLQALHPLSSADHCHHGDDHTHSQAQVHIQGHDSHPRDYPHSLRDMDMGGFSRRNGGSRTNMSKGKEAWWTDEFT